MASPSLSASLSVSATSPSGSGSCSGSLSPDMSSSFVAIVGILGGGQLARMTSEAAHRLRVRTLICDPLPNSPAGQVADGQLIGHYNDTAILYELAERCNVITIDIEHVNCHSLALIERDYQTALQRPQERAQEKRSEADAKEKQQEASAAQKEAEIAIERRGRVNLSRKVQPSSETIALIQDKYRQKQHLATHKVDVGPFMAIDAIEDIAVAGQRFGWPVMLKSRLGAYDGHGNAVLKSLQDLDEALKSLKQENGRIALYAEQMIAFEQELAVMVARNVHGECVAYPCVSTIQRDSICHTVIAPAQVQGVIARRAEQLALQAVRTLTGAGVFGVEMFLCAKGELLLNEIAPRPHNSGHYTIEACHTSQFEQHLRCILGWPMGSTRMRVGAAIMINVLGSGDSPADVGLSWIPCQAALSIAGAQVHWYGKEGVRKGRKLGHITITADTVAEAHSKQNEWEALVSKYTNEVQGSVAPVLSPSFATSRKLAPLVGVIMGSDSDLKQMKAACEVLSLFNVPFECTIVSAHRTPERMFAYARSAYAEGLRVIIAGAGGAAHLPGMVAALTCLPVIGVPIALTHLDGKDSLYSIVQMPRGVPCATVAINNATNAGLLAVRMLGLRSAELANKMELYQSNMEKEVQIKIGKLQTVGWDSYNV